MFDLNRATILGRLTRDPEVRSTPTGRSVATLGVATNRMWTDQAGQRQKEVEYHNVVLWGKLAELAGQYLRKGARMYAEGRLRTREWTGQDGVKRRVTEVIAENLIMLDTRTTPGEAGAISAAPQAMAPGAIVDSAASEVVEEEIKVEDIPF